MLEITALRNGQTIGPYRTLLTQLSSLTFARPSTQISHASPRSLCFSLSPFHIVHNTIKAISMLTHLREDLHLDDFLLLLLRLILVVVEVALLLLLQMRRVVFRGAVAEIHSRLLWNESVTRLIIYWVTNLAGKISH